MKKICLKDKEFELFIPEKEVLAAIERIAVEIKRDMDGKNPLFVGVLNGAFMFIADLMRRLDGSYELTFARYSSYRGTSSTGTVKEILPLHPTDVEGRTVILLEDIVDSGFTMSYVMSKLREQGAAEVKLATMLFKPDALKCDLKPDYVGIEIPNEFIVGYGLDYDEMGRAYRDIYKIVE
ncbi:MAG: hypoxanthine phosphoribosyltransferase [Tannerellaceae bacterium]|nr:hypoxanthine phosphoribosyltransferase [Tannerellaceae bacterium]